MDEKPFIGQMFLLVSRTHQIPNSVSDVSTVSEHLTVACQRRWCGLPAVQEAAMLCRILLLAVFGLSLGGCVPYYDEGGSYYSSEVYTSPSPTYYAGGSSYYSNGGGYYTPPPRYYAPPARYYQPTPRYYSQPRIYQPSRYYSQPRMYQPSRHYQSAPRYNQPSRGDYRMHQNHGWDGRSRGSGNNDYRGHDGRGYRNGRGNHR
ncbi:hypothetical protein EMIT0P258_20010 [Pseudomonas sp. IT-P258]